MHILTAILPLIVLVSQNPVHGRDQDSPGTAKSRLADRVERTDAIFAAWSGTTNPGCAVAILDKDTVVYSRGFGLAQLEHAVPISPETVFHIASVSKQFVVFAVCLLEQDGALSLDDDIRTYVPEVPDLGRTITLRHLIHHRSGLRDQWDLLVLAGWRMDDVITRDDVIELVSAQRELNFDPGTDYAYCNTGYTLLGMMVERSCGSSLDAFCQERMFEPLGMSHTHFHDDHRHLVPNRAECYWRDEQSGASGVAGYRKAVLSYAIVGATSLFTTAEDLMRWERNFGTGEVGGPEVLARMDEQYRLPDGSFHSYGMGIGHGELRGRPARSHSGGDAGFASYLVRFPDEHLAVAVLANTPMPTQELALRAADVWLPDPTASPPVETTTPTVTAPETDAPDFELPAERLEAFVGRWASQAPPLVAQLAVDDTRLRLTVAGSPLVFTLHPASPTAFRVSGPVPGTATVEDADGAPARLVVDAGGRHVVLRPAPATPADQLLEYVGTYESPELDVRWAMTLRDGALHVRRRKYGERPLVDIGDGLFIGPQRIRFERSESGEVTGFRVFTDRVRGLWFERENALEP